MNTALLEREKYRKIWTQVPDYRCTSPGEKQVATFLKSAQWDKGDTLIDCGAGTGRASKLLSKAGLNVLMLDITPCATDDKIDLPLVVACLWAMPFKQRFDWVYCCDVLEHIPTEHVDATLDNLATMTGFGAFLQIALFNDGFGRMIGQTLHLTVKPAAWWLEKIAARWHVKSWTVNDGSYLVAMTGETK
jgi:2-polyprenyl-3-methyl-5-hydroxy-6-metoxy-1,4-benzoquinol methylase